MNGGITLGKPSPFSCSTAAGASMRDRTLLCESDYTEGEKAILLVYSDRSSIFLIVFFGNIIEEILWRVV